MLRLCRARKKTMPPIAYPRMHIVAPWRNQRGMALLVTLMILTLLVAVTIQYHKTTWQKYVAAYNHKTATQGKMIAGSALQIGIALLQYDGAANSTDSLLDPWAVVKDEDVQGFFPDATMHLEVIDLAGRLQINSLVQTTAGAGKKGVLSATKSSENQTREILRRLLLSGHFAIGGELQVQQLLDALVDWLDADDQESDQGAENSYYRSLTPSYSCRNGPVEYIEELLLVKGMTPELLFGTATTEGLAAYLTVFGEDGKININTAPRLLLASLDPLITDDLVDRLDAFRKDVRNADKLADPKWYKNINGWPGDIVIYESVLSTQSTYFQINGVGKLDNLSKKVSAVVQRVGKGRVKLLWQKVE